MPTKSTWAVRPTLPRFPSLREDLTVDVAIVGGGITGVTAAYLLKEAGRSVALLERNRCGAADTGHTTAHLTQVTDIRLSRLVKDFGKDHAQAAWDAGRAAIEQIAEIVRVEGLDCDFAWVPGFLHARRGQSSGEMVRELEKEADFAQELGFDAVLLRETPHMGTVGVRFANQARFHPLQYLAGLLKLIPGDGCHVFEEAEVKEVTDDPLTVTANGHSVRCEHLVIATHIPLVGKAGLLGAALFQSKLFPYSSYAIGVKAPKGSVPEALFWDTSEPYRYLRVDPHSRHDYLIFGGEDHKTGQKGDEQECFRTLEEWIAERVPEAEVMHRWSGQVIETNDGLPFIGETAPHQFAATGFAGNGMTFGTLAGMMARDAFLGRKNPWKDLFDPGRTKIRGGTWDYIKENLDYPYYMVKDRFRSAEGDSLRELKRGEGKILDIEGKRVAAYRDRDGKVSHLSPYCTHMGCIVAWNSAEDTWDCPCHGSRFRATGEVHAGPAESPLEKFDSGKGK